MLNHCIQRAASDPRAQRDAAIRLSNDPMTPHVAAYASVALAHVIAATRAR